MGGRENNQQRQDSLEEVRELVGQETWDQSDQVVVTNDQCLCEALSSVNGAGTLQEFWRKVTDL